MHFEGKPSNLMTVNFSRYTVVSQLINRVTAICVSRAPTAGKAR